MLMDIISTASKKLKSTISFLVRYYLQEYLMNVANLMFSRVKRNGSREILHRIDESYPQNAYETSSLLSH